MHEPFGRRLLEWWSGLDPTCRYLAAIDILACGGMAYPAILGRRLDRPVVNLGFSGNGTMDPSVGALMAELDASIYVIDCLPNMGATDVAARTGPLVR